MKADEIPEFENYRVKAGEQTGYIACNEMILYKLPMDVYQEVMSHFHHEAPLEEAEKIKRNAEAQVGRDSRGKPLGQIEGEGLDNIDKPIPAPTFHG